MTKKIRFMAPAALILAACLASTTGVADSAVREHAGVVEVRDLPAHDLGSQYATFPVAGRPNPFGTVELLVKQMGGQLLSAQAGIRKKSRHSYEIAVETSPEVCAQVRAASGTRAHIVLKLAEPIRSALQNAKSLYHSVALGSFSEKVSFDDPSGGKWNPGLCGNWKPALELIDNSQRECCSECGFVDSAFLGVDVSQIVDASGLCK